VTLLACIGIESLADQQQWTYQNAKHATPSKSTRSYSKQVPQASYTRPEDLRRGFITGGLFRYSRHPNFAAEQTIWYIIYVFGCVATVLFLSDCVLNCSVLCGIGLSLLRWLLRLSYSLARPF
jgi:steroid 5-alpha reductase family enzyme